MLTKYDLCLCRAGRTRCVAGVTRETGTESDFSSPRYSQKPNKQGGAEQELVVCLPWIPVKSGLVQSDDAALSTPAGRVESTAMQYIPSWAHSSSHITLSGTGLQQLQLL